MKLRQHCFALFSLALIAVLAACAGAVPTSPSGPSVVATQPVQKPLPTTAPQATTAAAQEPEATEAPAASEAEKALPTPSAIAAAPQTSPAAESTTAPEATPTAVPTTAPTVAPTTQPIAESTAAPAVEPTAVPTTQPTAEPTTEPTLAPTVVPTTQPTTEPTAAPAVAPTVAPTAAPTAVLIAELRLVELEWPPQMRLGDSDVVRMALIPSQEGYTVTAEFAEHQTVTRTVSVRRPSDYNLAAVARLDGIGFDLSPQGDQVRDLPAGETVDWRWTLSPRAAGQQRLSISLLLRWTPATAGDQLPDSMIFSKSLNVSVTALLGMTTSQATTTGLIGLAVGGGLCGLAFARRRRPVQRAVAAQTPNPDLVIEPHPGLLIPPDEDALLRTLFRRYQRLIVESEFRSGYSGARTLLALPIRADGRADAYTIAKIGPRDAIQREFENYEAFVKDTLPPMTARIQEPPVSVSTKAAGPAPSRAGGANGQQPRALAVLRYTFIGEPGHNPISLREALLANPDPALLTRLFDTFGPNWWMQRRAYTFRLAQEYDRMLPAHYVLEPASGMSGQAKPVTADTPPGALRLEIGDCVSLRGFTRVEPRADGKSLSLTGVASPGQPPLRLRWMSTTAPDGATGRVTATRESLLRGFVAGYDRFGLPDPLPRLPVLLDENVIGSQSTIHGDLNLENVLVGPGGFVWLIDFAQTRDGHTLYDFAHLAAEVIAHVIAGQVTPAQQYADVLRAGTHPLLNTLHGIAGRCLFNSAQPREYHLALSMACLGALKFTNLSPYARHLLYLTAAHVGQGL